MMVCILKIRVPTSINKVAAALLLFAAAGAHMDAHQGTSECDANTVFQRAGELIASRQYDQASAALNRFQMCAGRSALENFQLGWLYGRARQFEAALKVFETVPPDVPDPLTHAYAIALSRFELAQYQQAIDILKPEQSAGKIDDKAANLLAVSYSKLGFYREAYGVLSEQARREPGDLTTYLNLVTVCAEGGDVAEAARVANHAAQLFPTSPDIFVVLGAAETMLGHLDQAYQDFLTSAKLAPSRADARFFLALINYKQAKFSDAVTVLQRAVRDGIADSDVHYLMAECLLKMDSADANRAMAELDRAIALNPESISARTLRGKLLLESNHAQQALADLEAARTRDPKSRAVLYNLARAYQAVGETSKARSLFSELRSQNVNQLNEMTDARLNEALNGSAGQQQ